MPSIDPTGQLVAIIRQQVASARSGPLGRPLAEKNSRAERAKNGERQLSELIAQRVRSIDPDEPNSGRKAFRVFLESVLLKEFGIELINDPAFYRLIDEVQCSMESEASLIPRIEEAGRLLLSEKSF